MSSIKNLVERSRQHDLKAFEELVLLYQDRVFSQCSRLAGNPDDAQDLAQEVFLQAFRGIKSFRNDADFGTWLHRIAINSWINLQRRNKKVIAFSLDEPMVIDENQVNREIAASDESPLEIVERQEFTESVYAALQKLQPDFKNVLVLREFEEYSYEEIANILGCSLGTVKSRINRARRDLKEIMNSKYSK